MFNVFKKIIIVAVALWVTGCAQTSVRHHQDFEEVAKTVSTVVVLPADVEVELLTFDGENEMLEEKSTQIRNSIDAIAKAKLKEENLNVIEFDFATEIAANEDFAYAITTAKEAWGKAKEDMYQTGFVDEKKKAEFQTSFGSVLNIIADKTNADAVLLMHYSGFEKSEGLIAKDLASSVLVGVLTMGAVVPVQATSGSFIDVALVDANSGKVIWANRKPGATTDEVPASVVFSELPDLVWKSELTNTPEVASKNEEINADEAPQTP
ncbi:hypothetical protein [Thalassotalea litorea]|uniref:hypothetical protein n=1 Tax=Thalassotalea litorea TaxID=2020715 RepID=UPI0037350136